MTFVGELVPTTEQVDRDPPPAPARGRTEAKIIPLLDAQPTLF